VNEIEPNANEPTTEESAVVERSNVGIDLATRPDGDWLNTVQNELNDTDLVLKCLARDSAKMCQTCDSAQSAGELGGRPMLARCASTKQPR
jgi:hypothetical protein